MHRTDVVLDRFYLNVSNSKGYMPFRNSRNAFTIAHTIVVIPTTIEKPLKLSTINSLTTRKFPEFSTRKNGPEIPENSRKNCHKMGKVVKLVFPIID